jgi:hypothetical protein
VPSNKVSLELILVINGFDKKWCKNIKNALTNQISESVCITKIWKPEVLVMNDKSAVDFGLIV